jgi:hypothetical protein
MVWQSQEGFLEKNRFRQTTKNIDARLMPIILAAWEAEVGRITV